MVWDILWWAYSAVFNRFKREEAGWPRWVEPAGLPSQPWIWLAKGFCQLHSFPVTHTSLQVSKTDAAASSEYYSSSACWASSSAALPDARTQKPLEEEGPFRSLTRPMSSLVVRAAITSNVTAATAASGNKVVKWLRWLAAACVRCWQQKLLKRLFTQPDFLQNLRVTKILVLSTTTSSVFVGRSSSFLFWKT